MSRISAIAISLGIASAIPLPAYAMGTDWIVLFNSMHFPHSVNAVQFDGNTCLHTPNVWNALPSNYFFLLFWEAPTQPNPQGESVVLWVQNGTYTTENQQLPRTVAYVIEQENSQTGTADLLTAIAGPGTNVALYASTVAAPIPRNGKWHLIAEAINTLTLQASYAVIEEGCECETPPMFAPLAVNAPMGGFTANWINTTDWWVGCGPTLGDGPPFQGPMAEFYLNLDRNIQADPPTIFSNFATPSGFAEGLSLNLAQQHDGAKPTGGQFPAMYYSGNANAFFWGVESAPGIFTETLTEVKGTLTTANDDPCFLRSPTGEGCQ